MQICVCLEDIKRNGQRALPMIPWAVNGQADDVAGLHAAAPAGHLLSFIVAEHTCAEAAPALREIYTKQTNNPLYY